MYYLNSRYYNPEWSRFINSDSLGGEVGKLLSHNVFVYCINNPVNMSDDEGTWPSWNDIKSGINKATQWVAEKVESFLSNQSPAYNWVEASVGKTIITGQPLSKQDRYQKVEKGLDITTNAMIMCSVKGGGKKAVIKSVELPTKGKKRYVPPKNWTPSQPLPKVNGGYIDKFDNVWTKGPSRTSGQLFEWDVQLSKTVKSQLGKFTRDGLHLNISLDGIITHK